MASAVSSIPTGHNLVFFLTILKPFDVDIVRKCQICIANENLDCVMENITVNTVDVAKTK